jgi:acetyl esterase/lipase
MRTERTHERTPVLARLFANIVISRSAGLILLAGTMTSAQASTQTLPSYIEKPADAVGVYAIYPGTGVPPGSEKWTWHEQSIQAPGSAASNRMVRNVVIPTVTMFKPAAGSGNGTAMIVAPGGAFTFLMVDYEGYDMARWLAKRGVIAFVLRYRVAHSPEKDSEFFPFVQNLMTVLPHPDAKVETPPTGTEAVEQARTWGEEDGRQAVRFVRQHAQEWGIDPHRIGIGGFSAGGGVTMGAVMQHDDESRPDFAIPVYAGYRTATPVPADAPPLFIAATDDDVLVAPISGARIYEEWHKAGKPAELHIFVKGQHGFGMKKQDLPSDAWINLLETWLANQGFMPSPVAPAGSHP